MHADVEPTPTPWPDSVLTYWNPQQKRSASYYAYCKPTGTWSEWHQNGALKSLGAYDINGQKTGAWKYWDKGHLMGIEYYSKGVPGGTWLAYNYGDEIIQATIYKSDGASITKTIDRRYGVTVVTIIDISRSGASKKTVIEPGSNKTTIERISEKGVMKREVKRSKKEMGRYEYSLSEKGKLTVKKVRE